jgi:hypothetical protein
VRVASPGVWVKRGLHTNTNTLGSPTYPTQDFILQSGSNNQSRIVTFTDEFYYRLFKKHKKLANIFTRFHDKAGVLLKASIFLLQVTNNLTLCLALLTSPGNLTSPHSRTIVTGNSKI